MKSKTTLLNMSERPIRVKSVNVQMSNDRITTFLQRNKHFNVLMIQEPWMGTVATLRSDTDPVGVAQQGAPFNSMWDLHLPRHTPDQRCRAITYTRKSLSGWYSVRNQLTHPLAHPDTTVIDIMDGEDPLIRLINVYNPPIPSPFPPTLSHKTWARENLKQFTTHELDSSVPTVIAGDFNTHARQWSLPGANLSSWASRLHDWFEDSGLSLLNPPSITTHRAREGS